MYEFNENVNYDSIFYVDTALVVLNEVGYPIGVYLLTVKRINPKMYFLLAFHF